MPPSEKSSVERLDSQIPGAFPEGDESQNESPPHISTQQTLSQALFQRRAKYSRPRNVRIKVGTWNVAGLKGTEKDIGAWFVHGKGIEESLAGFGIQGSTQETTKPRESVSAQEARSSPDAPTVPNNDHSAIPSDEEIGIYALGLQEVVDINSAAEALRPYTDPAPANRWKAEIERVLPVGYKLVAEQQLIGLLLLVYASPEMVPQVKSVSTTSVGTGLMGYMGNKGAVTARIVLGETTRLVFINSHLAAGADKAALERRNWDVNQIATRTRFSPITDSMDLAQASGETIGEEDFAFWFGDLNYRLEGIPGEDVRRLLTIHTRGLDPETSESASEVSDATNTSYSKSMEDAVPLPPELDPASLETTLLSLLPHDELHQQQKAGKAFHDGWKEGPIRFLPSYKYDIGKVGVFDSSEKKRGPSWCDRILYRTRTDKQRYDDKIKEQEEAKKRDEEMKAKGLDHAGDDEEVLYDYDPDTDGDAPAEYDEYDETADPEPEHVVTKEGFEDEICLEHYTTHLRVLSSDHKPLDAVFALKFDAVIPELKAAIHQEVVRELDRLENEGRPTITVVVDRSTGRLTSEDQDTTDSAFDGVDFGHIHYGKSKRRGITIANTGRVPATFSIMGPIPSWLTVHFDKEPDKSNKNTSDSPHEHYTLEPGEVCNAELKVKVDTTELVRNLNEAAKNLDDILVLRVQDGRDHFLPIHGRWLPSSLARSIDKLVKIPEGGIRKLQHQNPDSVDKVRWSVPREIFRLTEAIEDLTERALAEWEMTGQHEVGGKAPWQHSAGWPFVKDARYFADGAHEDTLANVYEALDCDSPFEDAFEPDVAPMQRLEILAEVLLQFQRSLQDGVVTEPLWKTIEEGLAAREKAKQQLPPDDEKMWILETLSAEPSHNMTFLLLMSMLERLAREITNAAKPKDAKTPRSSVELPASPQVSVRRKTLSKVPEVAIWQLVTRNYAATFAEVVFRVDDTVKLREKEKAARLDRMIRVIELFIAEGP
jgi:hypothetical protein